MPDITFDNPELNFPDEWKERKYDPFKRIIERMSTRMGGPTTDSINTNSSSIDTLNEAVDELEELIVLLQKRLKTTISMLELRIKQLEEKLETD